jgi:hypothetical protein
MIERGREKETSEKKRKKTCFWDALKACKLQQRKMMLIVFGEGKISLRKNKRNCVQPLQLHYILSLTGNEPKQD